MKFTKGWAFPDVDEFMSKNLPDDGRYQGDHLDAALRYVRGWSTAVDGGAHVGTWSFTMAGRFASVIAFEPSTDTFECLVHNLREREVKNVDTRNQALGAAPGKVSMTLEGYERGFQASAAALKTAATNTGARFTVPGGTIDRVTLDSLELQSLDFFKLDVEGGEVEAMMGARETLLRHRPIVLFEDKGFWRRYGYKRCVPQEFLSSIGAHHLERAAMDEIWGWL
jgi:FkbM family methyltransferase